MPFISIIIPSLNEEKHIGQCLDSIFAQEYPKDRYEVIVVDNGSTDRTPEIAKSYNVKFLQDARKNVSGLRNLGARHARGDILAFVDADCVVSKDWLLNAEKYFSDPSVIVWGGPSYVPSDGTWVQRAWSVLRQNSKAIEFVDWLGSINFFTRKEVFIKIGGFDEELITCEDVDLCYRIRDYGKIISDDRLKVVHLGEAATISEFFKKEVWRGRGNFQGIFSHGLTLKELPSLALPLYFGILIPLSIAWAMINTAFISIAMSIVLFFLPGIVGMVKTRKKQADVLTRLGLFTLFYVYFLARTCSFFSNIHFLSSKKNKRSRNSQE